MPRWPALSDTVRDSHLDLVKDRNSPDDLKARARKLRDAPHVGQANAGHEKLFLRPSLSHAYDRSRRSAACARH